MAVILFLFIIWNFGYQSCHCTMTWKRLDNAKAVCNDFSRAGYFMELTGTSKWLVYLESGGACYSPDTCNRRYFRPSVRQEFAAGNQKYVLDPVFNYTEAWLKTDSRPLNERVNIYMTSMETYNITETQGRDILDPDPSLNPSFYDYNRILVPYCSSDLWIANDTRFSEINFTSQQQFLTYIYSPESSSLQFVFRGKVIVQSVIEELAQIGLFNATDVILVGTSAGGIGAVNNANWLLEELHQSTNISIITDSSWFLNFHEVVSIRLTGSDGFDDFDSTNSLLGLLVDDPICKDISYGIPCCISLECMLSNPQYFPSEQVPVISIVSLYDVYLIAEIVSNLPVAGDSIDDQFQLEIGFEFLMTVIEYGGVRNNSIAQATRLSPLVSFIITECMQHVYLASSTLWDSVDGIFVEGLFESLNLQTGSFSNSFSHTVKSGMWSSYYFNSQIPLNFSAINDSCDPLDAATIRDAINMWKNRRFTIDHMIFRDPCFKLYCNNHCPDKFELTISLTTNLYPLWSKIVIIVIVVSIAALCILARVVFFIWEKKLECDMKSMQKKLKDNVESKDFPLALPNDKKSIACLTLKYSMLTNIADDKKLSSEFEDENPIYDNSNFITLNKLKPSLDITNGIAQEKENNANYLKGIIGKIIRGYRIQKILKGVTAYFNPGELTAIMGLSGSGKTTLLDLLSGRKSSAVSNGTILINGEDIKMNSVRDEYISKAGYVMQLATPYYEELTVRENLTLSAHMKMPNDSRHEKLERVEQTGIRSKRNTIVKVLSGGQKKRLTIALQLLTLPTVLLLDEPTSGLDAASSVELLSHLYKLAVKTERTVVLTIHQPRMEIFYMFHKLVLISDGKVAYYGIPQYAYEKFAEILISNCLFNHTKTIPEVYTIMPADVIMDILAIPWISSVIQKYYELSNEPKFIADAIKKAVEEKSLVDNKQESSRIDSELMATFIRNRNWWHWFDRMAVLEARARKKIHFSFSAFLTIFFFMFGILLGTVYLQQDTPLLILSSYCVFSCASALFMFPLLHNYFTKALEIYKHEKGFSKPRDIVLQAFFRHVAIALVPVIVSVIVLYFPLVEQNHWDIIVFLQLIIVAMALNQTWIALLIFVVNSFPLTYAIRISSIVSSIAGFSSGFFIPRGQTHWVYRWLFYINPNYYGLSASSNLILSNFSESCTSGYTAFQCYYQSSDYILKLYNFDDIRPYQNIAVLILMTIIYLVLAVSSHWMMDIFKKLTLNLKIKLYIYKHIFNEPDINKSDELNSSYNYFDEPNEVKLNEHKVFMCTLEKSQDTVDSTQNTVDSTEFPDHMDILKNSQDKVKGMFEKLNRQSLKSCITETS